MSLFTRRGVKDYCCCCAPSIHCLSNPFITRIHLRRRRHGIVGGISSSLLALSVVFRGLRSEASLPLSTLSSEGSRRPMCLRCTGTRHLEFLVPLFDAVPHRRVLSDLGPETSLHSHNWLCSGVLRHAEKPSVLPSPSNLIQTAPLATDDEFKRPLQVQTNLESFSLYMWTVDVDVLGAIQVYRFCEMCPGIMTNPELY
jgi:hypothetical protein